MHAKYFNQYHKQLFDWHKEVVDIWLSSFTLGENRVNLSQTFQKTLNHQEELMKTFLESQGMFMEMGVKLQILFWDGYFELMNKILTPNTPTRDRLIDLNSARSVVGGWFHLMN